MSLVEGVSLLALLFVGMPLKYGFSIPAAVRVLGSLHGVLFLTLFMTSLSAALDGSLSRGRAIRVLGWSVVPFGFVAIERLLAAPAATPRT